jgi:hypothetical protein
MHLFPDHTVPSGTDSFGAVFLAVNCQATITQSLRDKTRPRSVHKNRLHCIPNIRGQLARHSLPESKRRGEVERTTNKDEYDLAGIRHNALS